MTLQQQCISLEIAQRLHKLGVNRKSLFAWLPIEGIEPYGLFYEWELSKNEHVPAYTVAELGEMLPTSIESPEKKSIRISYIKNDDGKKHGLTGFDSKGTVVIEMITADTEADARGLMICYLIENNLINLADINK